VRNQGKFNDRFDAVVLLSARPEVILDRVARRTTNDYGKAAAERELILHHLVTVGTAASGGMHARVGREQAPRRGGRGPDRDRGSF
jgi:hypothetical protein